MFSGQRSRFAVTGHHVLRQGTQSLPVLAIQPSRRRSTGSTRRTSELWAVDSQSSRRRSGPFDWTGLAVNGHISSRQTRKRPKGLEPPPGSCQRTTSRKKTRPGQGWGLRCDRQQAGRSGGCTRALLRPKPPQGGAPVGSRSAIPNFTAPTRLAFGAFERGDCIGVRGLWHRLRCASVRPAVRRRLGCNAATAVTEWSSYTSRCTRSRSAMRRSRHS